MLKLRIITALVLLSILLPAMFSQSTMAFTVVVAVLVSTGAWEWAKLNQYGATAALASALACLVLCALTWWGNVLAMPLQTVWIAVGCGWVILSAWLLHAGVQKWATLARPLRWLGGLCALTAAWLAAVQARMIGINFLLSVLVLVWAADAFAYFAGRGFGGQIFRRKLAPSISPGKTWEGVLGGTFGVLLCAFGWRAFDATGMPDSTSIYTHLALRGVPFLLLSLLFLTMMSVLGDLVESLFKRSAGVKDSSALLPGHGGVLDRVDALLPILPLAMMFQSL
ncbi:MAG: phosphatidate cytidylyltransferase [Rhodoferax sp.]